MLAVTKQFLGPSPLVELKKMAHLKYIAWTWHRIVALA